MSQFAKLFEAVKAEPKNVESKKKTAKKTEKAAAKKASANDSAKSRAASNLAEIPAAALKSAAEPSEIQTSAESSANHQNNQKAVGKSRDADYTQVLTYLRKETHRQIKKVLIDDANQRNVSDLVEELLSEWLSRQLDK